jgi:hypothetical protein
MRVKVTKASDAHALCAYVLDSEKQPPAKRLIGEAILASNMLGQTADELARELEWSAAAPRRKPVQKIAAHYSVSLTPGEQLSPKQMGAISRQLLTEMGHDRCFYFAVQHHDQEHKHGVQHWHVVAATVNTDNEWVNDSFSQLRTRQVERSLEERFGLVACPPRPVIEQKNLTTGEARRKERTGEVLPKEKLWAAIDEATADKPTMALLVTRLKAQDIEIRLRRTGDRYTGISFGMDGSAFAGRRLGRAYSFEGLQKYQSIYYDAAQDSTLQQVASATPAECRQKLADYDEYQRTLRDLYEHYAQSAIGEPGPECDRTVAMQAIAAGHSEQEVIQIIRQGDAAQAVRREFGQRAELDYSRQVAQAQIELWQRQLEQDRQAQVEIPEKRQRQQRQRQLGRSQLEL